MKVLCLFDYLATTGFATVSQNIVEQLTRHFGDNLQLDIIAINYFGEPVSQKNINVYSASLFKLNPQAPDDVFGRILFLDALGRGSYDGIFIIQDIAVITPIVPILKEIKENKRKAGQKQFKSILYFPIDGAYTDIKENDAWHAYSDEDKAALKDKLPEDIFKAQQFVYQFRGLEFFDVPVAYTEYARAEVLKHLPSLKGKLKVIYHGINPMHFYHKDAGMFKKEYFGDANRFVITNVNRNQFRKDIPNTILGFIEAKKLFKDAGLPNPLLYLHMHPNDPMGWNIPYILRQTSLTDNDYKLLDVSIGHHGASVEMLNDIYNSSDVYFTTALAEGFGLTVLEPMSTRTPVICPANTSLLEITDNGRRALLLEELTPCISIKDNTIREQTNIYEVAEKLLYVAQNRDKLTEMLDRAENFSKNISWQNVCKSWIEIFKKLF